MTFATDEKVDWKKYQKALPISNVYVIASKYLSVLITLVVSVLGSVVFLSLIHIWRDFRFRSYEELQAAGLAVDRKNYELVYTARHLTQCGIALHADEVFEHLHTGRSRNRKIGAAHRRGVDVEHGPVAVSYTHLIRH